MQARRVEIVAVAALVFATAAYLALHALRVKSYVWLVDEFLYTKAAQGFAAPSLHAQLFSEPASVPNLLYSAVLAVPYGVLSNLNAFKAAHLFNVLAFASTVVPLYLTARLLGARVVWALVGAALGTWIPWAVAVNALTSEALAYPVFAWAVLGSVVAIADPRPRNDVLALVAIGLAGLARNQLILLAPVFIAAVVLHELGWPGRTRDELRERMRGHVVLGGALLLGILVLAFADWSVLGPYRETTNYARFPKDLASSMANHLGHIVVGCGIVPALLWVLTVVRGGTAPLRRAEHAFALVSSGALVLLLYQAGFFSQQIAGGRLQERYVFYLVAFFAVGSAVALSERERPVAVVTPVLAGVIAAVIVGSSSYPVGTDALGVLIAAASNWNDELTDFVTSLNSSWTAAGGLAFITVVLGVLTAVALWVPRMRAALAAAVLLFCVVQTNESLSNVVDGMNRDYPTKLQSAPKAWVDGLTDKDAAVLDLVRDPVDSDAWIWTEFWNSRIVRRYDIAGRRHSADDLSRTVMRIDLDTGRLTTAHEEPLLVVAAYDETLGIRGRAIRTTAIGQRLLEPARPYQLDWAYGAGTGDNAVGVEPTPLHVYEGSSIAFDLEASAGEPVRFEARSGSTVKRGVLRGGEKRRIALDGIVERVVQVNASQDKRVTIKQISP